MHGTDASLPLTDPTSPIASGALESAATTNTCDLSIVIVSWNTRDLLDTCLRSVLDGGLGDLRAEIIIVDNASGDGSAAWVCAHFPGVCVIENPANVGFARACNQGLRGASGLYFLLLNPDTIVSSGALSQLVNAMDARPDVAVASPLLQFGETGGFKHYGWARFPDARSEWAGHLDLSQSPYPLADCEKPDAIAQMEPFAVDWVGGACFCVRAEAAKSVGLFDEAYFLYGEDVQWCVRFRRAGWKTVLVPSITVTHLGGASSDLIPFATRRHRFVASMRLFRFLYGPVAALPAIAAAYLRYAAFRVRYALKRGAVRQKGETLPSPAAVGADSARTAESGAVNGWQ